MQDSSTESNESIDEFWSDFFKKLPKNIAVTVVNNKVDISKATTGYSENNN
jgi:hypothetical protein